MTEKQKDTIDLIEPLNVEARYPTHKEKLMQTLNYDRCKVKSKASLKRHLLKKMLPHCPHSSKKFMVNVIKLGI